MRLSPLLLPAALLLLACGPEASLPPRITPTPGAYRATLMGYTVQSCDATLAQPVGVLDTTVRITPPSDGRIIISGSRLWTYGQVSLLPGNPDDPVDGLAWVGAASAQADIVGCAVQAGVTIKYFPVDADQGNLQALQRYSAAKACALHLPCESQAVWSLSRYGF